MIPVSEPLGTEGVVLGAGANAALRRPLDRFVLESWVAKLVDVPQPRARAHPGSRPGGGKPARAPGEHFYGLTRNLSVHGMLLASPVRIEAEDLDLEIDLPEPEGRIRVLGRSRPRGPGGRAGPTSGTGSSSSSCPRRASARSTEWSRREGPSEPSRPLWAPGAIHSTVRRDEWIYELTEPRGSRSGFLVEIRRAAREDWRPGGSSPFYVVQGATAIAALDTARSFVREHG